jgi:hypothetical protein
MVLVFSLSLRENLQIRDASWFISTENLPTIERQATRLIRAWDQPAGA